MITEIVAPKTGLTAEIITIVKWHKREGDAVSKDELLLTIETEKTTLDISAPRSGYLVRVMVGEGESVPIAQVIGLMADAPEELIPPKEPIPEEEPVSLRKPISEEGPISLKEPILKEEAIQLDKPILEAGKRDISASPVARKIAAEQGIKLAEVRGTGQGGRIQKVDMERYLMQGGGAKGIIEGRETGEVKEAIESKEGRPGARSVRETVRVTPVRRTIARKTVESKTTIPHYYLFSSIDVTDLLERRREFEQSIGVKPSIDALIIKACALTLEKYPLMNASWDRDVIRVYEEVNIGFAVETEAGIVIPHIMNPQKMALIDLERKLRELVERARGGRISPGELCCGALSISNLGMYAIDRFVPIIYPGEVAMLGIGRAQKVAVWSDGGFVPRDLLEVTLSLDHRIIDGSYGARFLQDLKKCLEAELME